MENSSLSQGNNQRAPVVIPKSSNSFFIGLSFLLLFLLIVTGFSLYQNSQLKKRVALCQTRSPLGLTPLPILRPTTSSNPTAQPTRKTEKLSFPIVVFEPPLSTREYTKEREELQKKVVNPYIDYNRDTNGDDYLVSLLIQLQHNENIKKEYPYSLIAIYKNDGAGWESLIQKDGVLSWWIPTCMDCKFSEDFKSKYPEIIATFGL
ncbi:hypothetical protein FJZ40_03985 [Candidatus Shapirobacteria bacterium]|nr:hypothetical protein [Candidatus Shapirobacteria bacterium]